MGRPPVQPLIFWSHPVAVTVRTGEWTPVPFNNLLTTQGRLAVWTRYQPTATTIAAGSNGAVLPQATINVVSTNPSPLPPFVDFGPVGGGFLCIRIAGKDTVVRYTGKNATQFTGCSGGIGTLTTGDAVAQANVDIAAPPRGRAGVPSGGIASAVAEVAFAANAAGDRGLRFRDQGLFELIGGTKTERACANNVHHIQSCEQPGWSPTGGVRLEMFQDSGVTLDAVVDQLAAPRIVAASLTRRVA